MNNFDYGAPPTPPSPEQQNLTPAAIGLIATGGLNAIAAMLILVSGLARLVNHAPSQQFARDAERLGYLVGTFVGYGAGVASLLFAPVLIAGGIAMLRGKSLSFVRAAAILAMIPVTSCCCVVGIPVGIWVFRILKKPEVEAYFRRQTVHGSGPTPG